MARLTETERRGRRALDYRLACAMRGNDIVSLWAYAGHKPLQKGQVIDEASGEAGRATHYLAELRFPVLVGAAKTTKKTLVTLDISKEGYPFAEPMVQVVSRPLPWSPHVSSGGLVCIGEGWRLARGRMTLVDLLIHVMRILNCDEPDREPGYTGWNAEAVSYWRTKMNKQPLTPGLPYPVAPVEITHGVTTDGSAAAFAPVVGHGALAALEIDEFAPVGLG